MVKVRVRPETGALYLDFRYLGKRCREQTALKDSPTNRKKLESLARRIEKQIACGTFDYARTFPSSPRANPAGGINRAEGDPPTFGAFAEQWFEESRPRWRNSHVTMVRSVLDKRLLPRFSNKPLEELTRGDLLGFRAELAQEPGRGGSTLSARRINKIMMIVRSILNEGCDRHGLISPGRGIKPLKQTRTNVLPFNLEEVNRLISNVRADYRPYVTVRILTGMRTGEADGLQWQDIDFAAELIHVRRTHSRNGDGDLKTDFSERSIPMVPPVREALETQRKWALAGVPWVFHTRNGKPIDAVNFTNRVWYPLLRHLGLIRRPPYQMRHTAATLMLASGENPEWVARMLGHSTTEMLFRVYSRFVPNLTRDDGRAFSGLLLSRVKSPDGTV